MRKLYSKQVQQITVNRYVTGTSTHQYLVNVLGRKSSMQISLDEGTQGRN